jgi:1-deoxy-D-xylulose-5-phosphate reductoisomerase
MKNLAILGSTGSIGCNTLEVVEKFPERFCVKTIAAKQNIETMAEQIRRFSPEMAVVYDETLARSLRDLLPGGCDVDIRFGAEGYQAAASYDSVDMVVSAMVGAAGLLPTLAGIDAGKDIALANKETLVMAGEIVMTRAAQKGIRILPVDSEHSAIFQSFSGQRREDFHQIHLTASGGPFRNRPGADFADIRLEDALNHPTWQMGKKITIDSATLMNKGLEVIEAKFLFDVPQDCISVVIHPQSIVHSMVSYRDGSIIAQLGVPDMKGAIAYAISYPERLPLEQPLPDFSSIGALTFEAPDFKRFPCLKLAYQACEAGGTMPAVLNAANEIAVGAFLERCISFVQIPEMIQETMSGHEVVGQPELSDILAADKWARETALGQV